MRTIYAPHIASSYVRGIFYWGGSITRRGVCWVCWDGKGIIEVLLKVQALPFEKLPGSRKGASPAGRGGAGRELAGR